MSIVTAFAGLMPMIASVMVSGSIWPDVNRAVTGRTAKLASAPPHALLKPVVLDSARMVARLPAAGIEIDCRRLKGRGANGPADREPESGARSDGHGSAAKALAAGNERSTNTSEPLIQGSSGPPCGVCHCGSRWTSVKYLSCQSGWASGA